jgi:ABC-type multidrug transport system fused ATPase/permease subunit
MVLMESIGEALMPTTSVLIIILILFYIFAILFTELIGKASHFVDDEHIHEHFGTVGNSLGSLLQILTLDSWSATVRYVQVNSESIGYILLVWGLYVVFIVLAPLMMLNCLNAIFVEGVITKITHKKLEKVKADLNAKHELAERLKQIFQDLDKSGDGFVTTNELDDAIETTDVLPQIKRLGLKRHHLEAMFVTADDNGDGQIDCVEFLRGFSDLLNIPLSRKDIVKMAAEQSSALAQKTRADMTARLDVVDRKINALLKKMGVSDPTRDD